MAIEQNPESRRCRARAGHVVELPQGGRDGVRLGLTARDKNLNAAGGDEYEQAKLIFSRIAALVKAAGGSLRDVVKLNIYLTNIGNRELVWRARAEAFDGAFPASTLVEVSKLAPGIAVEIEAVAVLNQGGRPGAK